MALMVSMALGVEWLKTHTACRDDKTVIRVREWSAGTFCSRSELQYELVICGFENMQGPGDGGKIQ